jgi:hypothetical protein
MDPVAQPETLTGQVHCHHAQNLRRHHDAGREAHTPCRRHHLRYLEAMLPLPEPANHLGSSTIPVNICMYRYIGIMIYLYDIMISNNDFMIFFIYYIMLYIINNIMYYIEKV